MPVKSFLWVKVLDCQACARPFDLFPGYVLAEKPPTPRKMYWSARLVVTSTRSRIVKRLGIATPAASHFASRGLLAVGRCDCPHCGQSNIYPGELRRPLGHRLFAIEYYNPKRKAGHRGRFFKKPDAEDLARVATACQCWEQLTPRFAPDEAIPPGDETDRLHRWGYACYLDMFNPRQLLGLELSCRLISEIDDQPHTPCFSDQSFRLAGATRTCFAATTRWRSRPWIFSPCTVFPLDSCSANPICWELSAPPGPTSVRGGWSNIIEKYVRAKRYCETPYEVRRHGSRNVRVPVRGEWIGEELNGRLPFRRPALRERHDGLDGAGES